MSYNFEKGRELGWFILVAVAVTLLQSLVDFDPQTMGDTRAWLVSLGAASVRAGAGAALAWLTRHND